MRRWSVLLRGFDIVLLHVCTEEVGRASEFVTSHVLVLAVINIGEFASRSC